MSRSSVVPLLIVLGLYGWLGPSPACAGVLMLLSLASLPVRSRVAVNAALQVGFGILVVALGTALFATFLPRLPGATAQLPTGWAAFAGASLTASVARRFVAAPAGGESVGLALELLALMACGGTAGGALYSSGVVAFLGAALLVRRHASPSSMPFVALVRRHGLALVLMGVVAASLTWVLAQALPGGHGWAMRRLAMVRPPAVGVGDRLWLGSMRGLLDSNQPVMRVRGEADLLRGVVYNRYELGRWWRDELRVESLSTPPTLGGPDVLELEWLDGEPTHYFLPLDTSAFALSSGLGRVDSFGLLDAIDAHPAARVYVRRGETRALRIDAPSLDDVRVPVSLEAQLRALSRSYTQASADDAARLEALVSGLRRDHPYSLEFERSPYGDPMVEFLRPGQGGHCEYFAASMALLARSVGIPARVVVGYRVIEKNPLSGDSIVRERDAHAWVEAWVGDWRTFDPTPSSEAAYGEARETPLGLALLDVFGAWRSRFFMWLDGLSVVEALTLPVLLVLFGAALRWRRSREGRARQGKGTAFQPLPCFLRLTEALAARGLELRVEDSVEAFAQRVGATESLREHASECAEALRGYAALRYGDRGDEASVALRLDGLTRAIRTPR